MFARALVATDLGPASEGLVEHVGSLIALGVREVVLTYVLDFGHEPASGQDQAFARQSAAFDQAGVALHVETPVGYPPHAITSLAAERGADLIVMGTRGQGLFHTGFSGSVSSDTVRLSPVPVLLLPARARTHHRTGILESVLLPTGLGGDAERLVDLACSLAPGGIRQLELLHVVEMTFEAVREEHATRAARRLEALRDRAARAGVRDVRVTVTRGAPDDTTCRHAASGDYSLVVLAPRCRDTIDQAFGSVTSAVIRHAAAPLLLAPPGCDIPVHGRGNT